MPPLKKTVVAELSWDAFPPPPPEAENWVPDPDSIARSGTLKDPRLHKDPYAEQKKSAMKREMRFQSTSRADSISSASGSSAPAVRAPLGAWPAQAVRSSGSYLEIIVPPRKKHTTESPTIIAQTMPQTIPQISFQPSVKSVALPHTIIPAWAGPLEKALTEDTSNMPPLPNAKAPSLPPHLRKRAAASYQPPSLDSQYEAACEATRRVSDPMASETIKDKREVDDSALAMRMAAHDLGVEDAKQGFQLQQGLLEDYTAMPPAANAKVGLLTERQRLLNVKLIRFMEEDLDVGKHALTKRELLAMSQKDFDAYLAKVMSAHENWYIAEHRSAYVLKNDLAAFQAHERHHFSNGSKANGISTNGSA